MIEEKYKKLFNKLYSGNIKLYVLTNLFLFNDHIVQKDLTKLAVRISPKETTTIIKMLIDSELVVKEKTSNNKYNKSLFVLRLNPEFSKEGLLEVLTTERIIEKAFSKKLNKKFEDERYNILSSLHIDILKKIIELDIIPGRSSQFLKSTEKFLSLDIKGQDNFKLYDKVFSISPEDINLEFTSKENILS